MAPVNVEDLRRLAKRRLPRVLFDYVDGAAHDEVTLRANREDLQRIRFRPRVLVDVSQRSLATEVFGERLAMPLILAPVGSLGLLARDGELAAARAAERCGVGQCLSTAAVRSIEEMRAARSTPFWFQLYMSKDRGHARNLIERAQAAGCNALVFTVDTQVYATRERDVRNGYSQSPRLKTPTLLDLLTRWHWIADVLFGPTLKFGNMAGGPGKGNFYRIMRRPTGGLDASVCWKDFDWVRSLWNGPLVIKGVVSPEDARIAVDRGAQGVVVSNHGGRQLDGTVSTISALPAIADAIGHRATVLFDGGIRRGPDVLKALALGAKACLIGRAYAYGIAALGERGAELVLRTLEAEMLTTLGLLGRASVQELDRSALDMDTVRTVPDLSARASTAQERAA